jgi:pSer/pThr/pTyr-binding forkhead associated (FHA) protein
MKDAKSLKNNPTEDLSPSFREIMSQNSKEYPLLIAQSGPLEGQRWKIVSELLIGRDPDCDIVIPMRQVSRHHARVFQDSAGVFVQDLDSKNGTYINSGLIKSVFLLEDGSEIQIALAQHFVYLSSDATMPLDGLLLNIQKHRLQVDVGARRVWVLEHELDPALSAAQFNLLLILFERSGEVVSRPEVIKAVWGETAEGITEQALDALVRRLRDRITEIDPSNEYIVTVRGHGLRLDNPHLTV